LSLADNRCVDRHRTRILIADAQPLIRIGLHSLLSSEPDLEVVGDVARGDEVESAIGRLSPDLLTLEVIMLGLDAVGTTRHLVRHYPEVAILVLTACDNEEIIFGLLEAGVTGYALKEESSTSLLFAMRAVAGGQIWLSSRVTRMLVRKPIAAWAPLVLPQSPSTLTEREQEILALIGRGLTNQEIAEALYITYGTVHTHINRIYGKIGLDRRSQAVRYAIAHRLASAPPGE